MRAGGSQQRRNEVPLHGARRQSHPEGVRADGHARVALQTGQRLAGGHAHVERVQQRREEQEQLHPGEDLAQAHPPSDTEGKEVLGLLHFALGIYEAGGVEAFRLVPQGWVHVDSVQ